MFFKKIKSVYDIKKSNVLLSDFYDTYLFATMFMKKIAYPFEGYTDEDIYKAVYSAGVRLFIVDSLLGQYFI